MSFFSVFHPIRTTEVDLPSLLSTLKSLDASASINYEVVNKTYTIGKDTIWTTPQNTAVLSAIENAPIASFELTAQDHIDTWPVELRALVLALIDQINVIRGALVPPKTAITSAQAIQAIRDKAGTL